MNNKYPVHKAWDAILFVTIASVEILSSTSLISSCVTCKSMQNLGGKGTQLAE